MRLCRTTHFGPALAQSPSFPTYLSLSVQFYLRKSCQKYWFGVARQMSAVEDLPVYSRPQMLSLELKTKQNLFALKSQLPDTLYLELNVFKSV